LARECERKCTCQISPKKRKSKVERAREKNRKTKRNLRETLDQISGRLEQKMIVRHRRLLVRLLVHMRLTRRLLFQYLSEGRCAEGDCGLKQRMTIQRARIARYAEEIVE
jgi:hypothetical protein